VFDKPEDDDLDVFSGAAARIEDAIKMLVCASLADRRRHVHLGGPNLIARLSASNNTLTRFFNQRLHESVCPECRAKLVVNNGNDDESAFGGGTTAALGVSERL